MRFATIGTTRIVLAFLVTVMVVTPFVVAVLWSVDEIRLTTHYGFDGLSSVTQTSDGNIWVVWQRYVDAYNKDAIFYKTSSDLGGTWSDPTNLTTLDFSYQNTHPSIMETLNGTLWLVWSSDRTGNYDLFYKTSSNLGISWSEEIQLTYDPGEDVSPCIYQTLNGTLWLVWSGARAGNYEILYKTSSDFGVNWSEETLLTTDAGANKSPSIAQMQDGRIWVVWHSARTGDCNIYYRIHEASSWSNIMNLTDSTDVDTCPTILQTVDEAIWIFWSRRSVTPKVVAGEEVYCEDLYYKYSCDNGVTWSDSIQFTITDIYTVVEDGDILVCYNDDTWPSLVESSDTKLWVVWTSNRADQPDGNWDLYFRTSVPGDVNGDGVVDVFDLSTVGLAFGTTPGDLLWNPDADINKNDKVNIFDLAIVGRYYGTT